MIFTTKELTEIIGCGDSTVSKWVRVYDMPVASDLSKRPRYFDIFDVYDWITERIRNNPGKKALLSGYRKRLFKYIYVIMENGGQLYYQHRKIKEDTKRQQLLDSFDRVCTAKDVSVIFNCGVRTVGNWVNAGMPVLKGHNSDTYAFDLDEVVEWLKRNRPDRYRFYKTWGEKF